MTVQGQQVQGIKETTPLNLTGLLPQKFTPQTQGVRTDQFKKQRLEEQDGSKVGRSGAQLSLCPTGTSRRSSEEQSEQPMESQHI